MIAKVAVKIKTQIVDAETGRIIKNNPWRKNLVLDKGLNALGWSTGACAPCGVFSNMIVGSGNSPNAVSNGAITFTQSGTTITASGGFFTSNMAGCLFKYGTGTAGAEYYIISYTDSTHVVVDTSATVGTPTVATVWYVQKTSLDTLLYPATSYDTSAGSCSTTYAAPQVTFQRTFIVPQKGVSYSVNEIGYSSDNLGTNSNNCFGRFVLSSTDVVGTTNFYRVVIQIVFVFSPSAPTAVVNVGTNINTAGNAMFEFFDIGTVNSSGVSTAAGAVDNSSTPILAVIQNYSQNSAISTSLKTLPTSLVMVTPNWAYASVKGTKILSGSYSISTSGQTMYGICLRNPSGNSLSFDILYTTPVTLPTGTFAGTVSFTMTFTRNLNN